MHQGAMLNAYPDSLGRCLTDTVRFLTLPELRDAFRSFYLLPTVFNTDLDRGFSVISYDLCASTAKEEDLRQLQALGIDLTFDFILNHLSVLSPQFRDVLRRGDASPYRDFFIDWNKFWAGCGEVGSDGVLKPGPDWYFGQNLRREGLPILMVRFPDGRDVPYWNTFYQSVTYPLVDCFDVLEITGGQYDAACRLAGCINKQLQAGKAPADMDWQGLEAYRAQAVALLMQRRRYMGQMDINVQSPLVWQWYDETMGKLASYGAVMIRLDAFTRLHKQPGRVNFMNEPETWEILQRLRALAEKHGLEVLPEVHATHHSGAYRQIASQGCMTYDYFLPALLLDAIDMQDASYLCRWAREQIGQGIRVVNMLGCHDGIPMRDVRGALPDDRVEALIERLIARGGRRKMIHGANAEIYQMDITYYSALGCDDRRLLLARAVQLFMPGKPQVYYLDLLAGENDEACFVRDPTLDNREINRTAFTYEEAVNRLQLPVVADQLQLLRLRNTHPAFTAEAEITVGQPSGSSLTLRWQDGSAWAVLTADFAAVSFRIEHS